MKIRLRILLAAACATLVAGSAAPVAPAATALPAHVYAPYFETWTADSITSLAQQSGSRYFTLAFVETLSKSSCALAWDGSKADLIGNGKYLPDIASLRGLGGDVIPSFGGWSADQGGTEIGDSCKDVNAIAAAYEALIAKYDVSRLDMDIEGRSLTKPDGIDGATRRSSSSRTGRLQTAGRSNSATRCRPRRRVSSLPVWPSSRTRSRTTRASTS